MPNMTPTNLLQGIAKVSDRLNQPEFRMPNTAAVSMAYLGNDTPMASLRTREDRTTWYDWQVAKADEGVVGRTALHTGGRMDSARTQLTWGTVVDTFSISMKQLDNNNFTFEDTFAKGFLNSIQKNLIKFDNQFLALLQADVTQVNSANFGARGTFNAIPFVFELAANQGDYWLQLIESAMSANNYNEQMIALVDGIAHIDIARSNAQGAGNATNLAWQIGNTSVIKTNKAVVAGAYDGTAIVAPKEMVSLFPWIPKQNRKPIDEEKAMSTVNGDFGSISVPIYDDKGNVAYTIDAAVSIYTQRADTSALNGSAQDMVTEVEVSWDFAYMSAPLSTANESVVYAFGKLP